MSGSQIELSLMLSTVVAVGAIVVVILARRGRRVDDHPVCRRCGYDLVGRPAGSDRCAECGADLTRRRAVRVGNRVPWRRVFWVGLCLGSVGLVLSGVFGWLVLSKLDWMKHKPVLLLRNDASSADAVYRVPALAELARRLNTGELSERQIQAIISDALVLQADAQFPYAEWQELTNKLLGQRKIPNRQWAKFVQQAVRPRVVTLPNIRAGDPLLAVLVLGFDRLPEAELSSAVYPSGRRLRITGGQSSTTTFLWIGSPPPIVEYQWLDVTLSGLEGTGLPSRTYRYPFREVMIEGGYFPSDKTITLDAGVHTLRGRMVVHVLHEDRTHRISSFEMGVTGQVRVLPTDTEPATVMRANLSHRSGRSDVQSVMISRMIEGPGADMVVRQPGVIDRIVVPEVIGLIDPGQAHLLVSPDPVVPEGLGHVYPHMQVVTPTTGQGR